MYAIRYQYVVNGEEGEEDTIYIESVKVYHTMLKQLERMELEGRIKLLEID